MDFYTLKVDEFAITATRSPSTDNLHLAYSAYVDGDVVAQKLLYLGDCDSGNGSRVYHPDDLVSNEADKGGLAGVVIGTLVYTSEGRYWMPFASTPDGLRTE